MTKFVLLSTQRSGTSWLIERLAKHPRVGGYGELLLHARGYSGLPTGAEDRPYFTTFLEERGARDGILDRHRYLNEFLDYIYTPRRDLQAIGFKVMYHQALRYPQILAYFRRRRVAVIHLVRTNLLDVLLSREAMKTRRFVHARSESEREDVKVELDVARLPAELRRLEAEQRIASFIIGALGTPLHNVSYEQLRVDDRALHRTLMFLGVTDGFEHDLASVMVKLAPSSHREGIANFDDVADALGGSRFAYLLRP